MPGVHAFYPNPQRPVRGASDEPAYRRAVACFAVQRDDEHMSSSNSRCFCMRGTIACIVFQINVF